MSANFTYHWGRKVFGGFLLLVCLAGCQPSLAAECPITIANGNTPPGEQHSPLHHGNSKLFTALWPDGIIDMAELNTSIGEDENSLAVKFPWWRGSGVVGDLEIDAEFLGGSSGSFEAIIPDGYGDTGFQASALVFDRPGCWKVVGRVAEAELSFVTYVEPID
jgi:hypothetical protein